MFQNAAYLGLGKSLHSLFTGPQQFAIVFVFQKRSDTASVTAKSNFLQTPPKKLVSLYI
jgi:hypothetical protein